LARRGGSYAHAKRQKELKKAKKKQEKAERLARRRAGLDVDETADQDEGTDSSDEP
jgi:hypothetical protein